MQQMGWYLDGTKGGVRDRASLLTLVPGASSRYLIHLFDNLQENLVFRQKKRPLRKVCKK